MHVSSFRMVVGGVTYNGSNINMPTNFTLGLRGYTCGEPFLVLPTRYRQNGGRRYTQALGMCFNFSLKIRQKVQ